MCRLKSISTNFNTQIDVAEIKNEYIKNIITSAAKCPRIQQIILFGSAVSDQCTEESDIDILVISDVSKSFLYKNKDFRGFLDNLHLLDDYMQQYDVICVRGESELYSNKNKISLYQDVLNDGKIIYKRETE